MHRGPLLCFTRSDVCPFLEYLTVLTHLHAGTAVKAARAAVD